MKNENIKVELFLTREFFNSLISVLSAFIDADEESRYTEYAKKLKGKIMNYGRIFINEGTENVAIYFYENEAAMIIKLLALYVNATEQSSKDYFSLLEKNKKENAIV